MMRDAVKESAGWWLGDVNPETAARMLYGNTAMGVFRYHVTRDDDLVEALSPGLYELYGCETPEQFVELTGGRFSGMVHPDDIDRVQDEIYEQIADAPSDRVIYRIITREGEVRWIEDWAHVVADNDGVEWFYVTLNDITQQLHTLLKLIESDERQRILADMSGDVTIDIDCRGNVAEVFGDFEGRFGRSPQASDFMLLRRCKHECQLRYESLQINCHEASSSVGNAIDVEIALPDEKGEPAWCRYQSVIMEGADGKPCRSIGRLLDTHEMIQREMRYREMAERDLLTGAVNRLTAQRRIEPYLCQDDAAFSLLYIDVDDFKNVNDTYGHPVGDSVLRSVASLLFKAVRHSDIVARFGGDEFAVFMYGVGHGAVLDRVISQIRCSAFADLSDKIPQELQESLSLSTGVVCSNGVNLSFERLYSHADDALYRAKHEGKGCVCIVEL